MIDGGTTSHLLTLDSKGHDLTSPDNFSTIGGESTIIVATRKLYEVNLFLTAGTAKRDMV